MPHIWGNHKMTNSQKFLSKLHQINLWYSFYFSQILNSVTKGDQNIQWLMGMLMAGIFCSWPGCMLGDQQIVGNLLPLNLIIKDYISVVIIWSQPAKFFRTPAWLDPPHSTLTHIDFKSALFELIWSSVHREIRTSQIFTKWMQDF